MSIRNHSGVVVYAALVGCLVAAGSVRVAAQERGVTRPDLSGRWELNRDLSEDAKSKLESMRSSQGAGGHGPGRHGGFGGIFRGIFGGGQAAHAQLEEVILDAPTSFLLSQDDQKVVLTESDGRVRTLATNNRKMKVDGRDVRTKWENNRLVSEITVSNAKVIETYERSPGSPRLIVTARVDMRGQQVTVRRVYDAVTK